MSKPVHPASVSRRREWLLRLVLVITPFLLLGLLEVLFRLTGAFAPPPLVVSDRTREGEVWRLNPTVAARYFNPDAITLPTLAPQTFLKTKPDTALRIFCLGGSTTAGFPFDAQVPFTNLGEFARYTLVYLPIGPALPNRVDGLG